MDVTRQPAKLTEMDDAAPRLDWRARIDRLSVPTLCLHGGDDKLVPPEASAILEGLDHVERRVLDGLYHEIFNEPVGLDLLDDVVAWLDSHLP